MNDDDLDGEMLELLWAGGFVVFLFGFLGFVVWLAVTMVTEYGWGFSSVMIMFMGFLLSVGAKVVHVRFYT